MTSRALMLNNPDAITVAMGLASQVADTDFVPKSLRGRPESVLAAILTGYELGVDAMTSLRNIDVIEGTPSLRANMMRALLLRDGHQIWVEESTTTRCVMAGRRAGDTQITRVTWTMDDAKRARLAGKFNWQTYPRQMLAARATTELARLIAADTIAGLYSIEELEDTPDGEVTGPAVLDVPPARTRRRGPRRSKPEPTPTPSPTIAEIRAAFDTEPETRDDLDDVLEIDDTGTELLVGGEIIDVPKPQPYQAPTVTPNGPESPPPGETLPLGDDTTDTAETAQTADTDDTEDDYEPEPPWELLAGMLSEPATRSRMTLTDLRGRVRLLFDLMAQVGIPRWGRDALRRSLTNREPPAASLNDLTKDELIVFVTTAFEAAKDAIAANPEQ